MSHLRGTQDEQQVDVFTISLGRNDIGPSPGTSRIVEEEISSKLDKRTPEPSVEAWAPEYLNEKKIKYT